MASVTAEDGVLKLVHRGRNVEMYRKPVTAAEVMRKYPRHSVTRPDVFEYPWVVVRPESILNLGKVFFVVPNRTVYKLMKEHKEKSRGILSPNMDKRMYLKNQLQDSPVKINAGSTPKHLNRQRSLNQSPPSPTTTCMCTSSLDRQSRDLRTRKQNKVGSWPNVIVSKNENVYLKHGEKQKPVTSSRILLRSFDDDDLESTESKKTAEFQGKLIEFKHSRDVTTKKSCLRKPDSSRKLLQVSFFLPVEDKE